MSDLDHHLQTTHSQVVVLRKAESAGPFHFHLGQLKGDWLRNRSGGFAERRFGACPPLIAHFALEHGIAATLGRE